MKSRNSFSEILLNLLGYLNRLLDVGKRAKDRDVVGRTLAETAELNSPEYLVSTASAGSDTASTSLPVGPLGGSFVRLRADSCPQLAGSQLREENA